MEFDKTYKVKASIETVKKYLIDLNYFGEFHPLIVRVDEKEISSIDYKEYNVLEKPFLWLPIQISYSARVRHSGESISYEITGIPFTEMNINYTLSEKSESEVDIHFNLVLGGMFMGKKILANKMISAQDVLMAKMNAL